MPNKKKKGFRRSTQCCSTSLKKTKQRRFVRKQWSERQMLAALQSATTQGLSGNKAADLHGVPRSTLKDRLSGRVVHGTKSGPKPYLSPTEEAQLSSHLIDAAKLGFGKTRRDVKCLVETYVKQKGTLKGTCISNGWWQKFLTRNPTLRLRAGDSTAGVRMDAVNADNINAYYDLLRSVYDEFGFDDHPERIYNMDETGVPLQPRPPKIVAAKGQKKIRYRTSGQKSQITVIACGSATGQVLPPFIIFAAKQLNLLWTKDEVSGSRYAVSNKGWVDQELFFFWLKEHFLPNTVSQRPLLLLLDGHSSHFEPNTIQFAKDNDVIILCLPPHTTHECQPLDCSLFGPLKQHWREACHRFYQANPGKVISKLNFCSVFKNSWLTAVTPANICGGFKKAGVFPFNRAAVSLPDSSYESTNSDSKSDSNTDSGSGNQDNEDPSDEQGSGDGMFSVVAVSLPGSNCESTKSDSNTDSGSGNQENEDHSDNQGSGGGMFSVEEELLFAVRYEEGYDLFDPRYEAWLKVNHSETKTQSSASIVPPSAGSVLVPDSSKPSSSTVRSPFSDLLNLPSIVKAPKTGSARVLTSAQCLQLLKEKENKKRQVLEEKEKRKVEREMKKMQRELEQKHKAEERARKKAEREEAKAKKEEGRQKKIQQTKRKQAPSTHVRPKRKKPNENVDQEINSNFCCVCFGSYEEDIDTDREWLECCCGRWLHDDCIDEEDVDNSCNKLCPVC